jgi:hypothetical protein
LVLGLVLILAVAVVLFDLVLWLFMGVRSSGSITISIEESAGDEGILIPIASTISISTTDDKTINNKGMKMGTY